MNYYVLSQKKDVGCPVGDLRAALYDKFYADTRDVEYGLFPWYLRSFKTESRAPFSEGMVLIVSDLAYDFDVRGIGRFFYVVSDAFLSVCKQLNVDIVDSAEIQVLSKSGECRAKKKYHAVLFKEFDVRNDAHPATDLMVEDGVPFGIKKLVLPSGWDRDLFKYGRLVSGSNSLICSGRFKEFGEDFKGVSYKPLDGLIWSGVKRI